MRNGFSSCAKQAKADAATNDFNGVVLKVHNQGSYTLLLLRYSAPEFDGEKIILLKHFNEVVAEGMTIYLDPHMRANNKVVARFKADQVGLMLAMTILEQLEKQ